MLEFALRSFLTLLLIVDPLGLAPVFLGLVGDRPDAEQRRVAKRAVLIASGVLVLFGLGGRELFQYLGISLDALRIAGGILLFKIGVDMVMAQRQRETPEEEAESAGREDVSIFPLAIPLLAGPGAMASLLVLMADAEGLRGGTALLLAVALAVLGVAYVVLRTASFTSRILGQTGINVIGRVLGVVLAAFAVQYVVDGARALWLGG